MEINNAILIAVEIVLAISVVFSMNIIKRLVFKEKEQEVKGSRRMMQLNDFTHRAMVDNLNSYINQNIEYKKRNKIQKMLLQSGLNMTIADLVIISIASSISLALIMSIPLQNNMLFWVGLICGGMIPGQVIKFIRNRRVMKLDTQIASFIRMTVKRYYVTGQLPGAIEMTLDDFGGQEPITSEIKKTISDLEVGTSAIDALEAMEKRTHNEYLKIFVCNLKASNDIGTESMKQKLLDAVIKKFDKDVKMKSELKRETSSPVMQGFLLMLIVPATFIMQAVSNEEYLPFMINDPMGKLAIAITVALMFTTAWIIINKVGAPLEKEEE